jgi:ATP-dependent DNA helicase RecQ
MQPDHYVIVQYNDENEIVDRRLPDFDRVVQSVNHRLTTLGMQWSIRTWQAAVASECLAGRDIVVKAQTGSGKSLCYLSLAMVNPDECMLVICPLLALMADQVRKAIELGITAVQLCASTMKDDPHLLEKVREGEFSMVLVAAEFTASEAWKSLIRDDRTGRRPSFAQSLRRIIIDEAHLIREWYVIVSENCLNSD